MAKQYEEEKKKTNENNLHEIVFDNIIDNNNITKDKMISEITWNASTI